MKRKESLKLKSKGNQTTSEINHEEKKKRIIVMDNYKRCGMGKTCWSFLFS
jgi:hypothetical protein